jgi:hypothetical protein
LFEVQVQLNESLDTLELTMQYNFIGFYRFPLRVIFNARRRQCTAFKDLPVRSAAVLQGKVLTNSSSSAVQSLSEARLTASLIFRRCSAESREPFLNRLAASRAAADKGLPRLDAARFSTLVGSAAAALAFRIPSMIASFSVAWADFKRSVPSVNRGIPNACFQR